MKRICPRKAKALMIVFFTMFSISGRGEAQSQTDFSVPYKSITPQVESTIERTAIVALRHISHARSDIHRKALSRAKNDLSEAARLLESINDELSTTTTKNLIHIARKHLEYEQAEQVLHDLPPINSSLETISVYLPTDKAKFHIGRAKSYLERNDKRGAERELSLADKSLIVIEVELPLLKAQSSVTKALRYLATGNAGKADEALQVVEKRAMALYTGVNAPLFQAKQNMWLAFRNYSTVNKSAARPYLAQARQHLDRAAAEGSAKAKKEVGELSLELAEMEKKLTGEGKAEESALKAAWEKSKALSERSAAYVSAGISEAETTLRGESNLIEAKLHVEYADTYQVTTTEPDKAAKELDTAYSYLGKAEKSRLAGPEDRKKMRGIGRSLQALKTSLAKRDASVQERYDKVKDELSDLIQKI